MKHFTKISAIALFSLFLTACDKATTETSSSTATAQTAAKAVDAGELDYKKFREWQTAQEQSINQAINTAVEQLGEKSKDEELVQKTVNKALSEQIEVIKQSAAELDIKDEQVKALKDKSLEVIALGAELIKESEKVMANPTADSHKAFGELQAKLDQLAKEGQELENALMQKYEPAPEPVVTPVEENKAEENKAEENVTEEDATEEDATEENSTEEKPAQ